MWNVKAEVIPVITVVNGTISKSLWQHLSNIPGKYKCKELQKTAILGTAHILQKVLMVKVQNIFHSRNNIKRRTNCKYRTGATL
jgi:hypothetical protein